MPSQQLPLVNQREPLPPLMHFSLRFSCAFLLSHPSLLSSRCSFPPPFFFFFFFFFKSCTPFSLSLSLDSRYIVSPILFFISQYSSRFLSHFYPQLLIPSSLPSLLILIISFLLSSSILPFFFSPSRSSIFSNLLRVSFLPSTAFLTRVIPFVVLSMPPLSLSRSR